MKYLLDTDVCIYLINKRPSSVLEKLHTCRAGDVGVSAVTVAELRYGASKASAPDKTMKRSICSWRRLK